MGYANLSSIASTTGQDLGGLQSLLPGGAEPQLPQHRFDGLRNCVGPDGVAFLGKVQKVRHRLFQQAAVRIEKLLADVHTLQSVVGLARCDTQRYARGIRYPFSPNRLRD
jgi:hypothetical protein